MSASSKFDLSSRSPDRSICTSGKRGSYSAASLDRSGSIRENMENPVLSAPPKNPNMTRNSSAVGQGDVVRFFQCLRFDPKSMVVEHKLDRDMDFNRLTTGAVGVSLDDSLPESSKGKLLPSPSPEECRQLKSALRDSCRMGRERTKIFSDSLSVINNCFPSIPTRKRSRLDALSNDRLHATIPVDRSNPGKDIGKMRMGAHNGAANFELEHQKSEDRSKSAVQSKRARTSAVDPRMDVRANALARSSGNIERDREVMRHPNSSAPQGEDRTSSVAFDGWEKSKMKKKRSGIKPDVAGSSARSKPNDGYRESKQGMQSRLLADGQSKLGETHAIRSNIAAGAVGTGKTDANLQQAGLGMRSSLSRANQDNSPIVQDRRDRLPGPDRERASLRAINNSSKTNAREDLTSGSPTSSTKLNAGVRAPRSGSGSLLKSSPVAQRASAVNDWELSQCTSKVAAVVESNSRKRTPSAQSSPAPVTQWATQRPKKSSRTARTNIIPLIPSNDEPSALDTPSDIAGNVRHLPDGYPQVKIKTDRFSSAASESEESGAAETKSRDRSSRSDDIDENAGQNIQKTLNLPPQPRKNKVLSGDDVGTGFRRQGRSSRGFTSTRALTPLAGEKHGNVGTAKQLGNARHSLDRIESKAGRPPTRKLSDRRAYKRQKHSAITTMTDFLDDGHEELIAATCAVTNTGHALSSSFWKQMESFFRFISDDDIAYLKQQETVQAIEATPVQMPFHDGSSTLVSNGVKLNEIGSGRSEADSVEHRQENFTLGTRTQNKIPLYQRLMAAILPEGGYEDFCFTGNQDSKSNFCGSGFGWETDVESNGLCLGYTQSHDFSPHPASNGYTTNAKTSYFDNPDFILVHSHSMSVPDSRKNPDSKHSLNMLFSQQKMIPNTTNLEYHYNDMPIEERLLLEIHAIGIFPEEVPDLLQTGDEEITEDISRLDGKYNELVLRKKSLIGKLLSSASGAQNHQQREFEQRALDKLVEMAYQKYMAGSHGMKSASGKMARQSALAFVRRTLERYREFEEIGKSCFNDSVYRDMFLSAVSRLSDGELGKFDVSTPGSASLGAQQNGLLSNNGICSPDMLMSPNLASNQTAGKEEMWGNRGKRRELLLEDVGISTMGTSSSAPSGVEGSFSSSVKGKRSERDREGKGNSRDPFSRSGKFDRPASTNVKGERKSKARPRQKTGQLSASVNSLLGRMSERQEEAPASISNSAETDVNGFAKAKTDHSMEELEAPIDLSGLQLPEMDDLGGQGQDLGSWFSNIDDDVLPDDEILGLEIPMDDLSELNMMV